MSRVGREPIALPAGVSVTIKGSLVKVKGKLGELERKLPEGITAALEDGRLHVRRSGDSRRQRSLHGLSRSLVANMVQGVAQGFSRELEIVGVGYRCEQRDRAIQFSVGFSHRVLFIPPEGILIKVTPPNKFTVSGIDRQLVGEVAAKLRSVRPPEPYKGKGIMYVGEHIRRKAGKTAGK